MAFKYSLSWLVDGKLKARMQSDSIANLEDHYKANKRVFGQYDQFIIDNASNTILKSFTGA